MSDAPSPIERPRYLLLALIALWCLGMHDMSDGWHSTQLITDPLSSTLRPAGINEWQSLYFDARFDAIASHNQLILPLSIGQLMLGAMLAFISTHALFGGRASVAFALQVIGANALLLIFSYILWEPLRQSMVELILQADPLPKELLAAGDDAPKLLWGQFRASFGLQLTVLLASALALSRRGARDYLGRERDNVNES
ncbi:MAG: hypothetical protein HRU17_11155 [Polyangiaceae bacterium]|nr:hypothetical protein [Polyangiaceae bacterium]